MIVTYSNKLGSLRPFGPELSSSLSDLGVEDMAEGSPSRNTIVIRW